MSLDSSLKTSSGLSRHRNVLTRAERIERLTGKGQFSADSGDPLGLPKVANRKVVTGGKAAKKAAAGTAAEGEAAATPDAAAAPAGKSK